MADAIVARHRAGGAAPTYDGYGVCYPEFGKEQVAKVGVTFRSGEPPVGDMSGPSTDIARDKTEFGAARIRRWFGKEWAPH